MITWAELLESYIQPLRYSYRDDVQREETMRAISEDMIETILTKLAMAEVNPQNSAMVKALEIAEGYVRAAAFKEASEPPYEHGEAHKHLAIVHAALARYPQDAGASQHPIGEE